jgi:hypothetical protein
MIPTLRNRASVWAVLAVAGVLLAGLAWRIGDLAGARAAGATGPQVSAIYRGVRTAVQFDVSPPLRTIAPLAPGKGQLRENENRDLPPQASRNAKAVDTVVQKLLGPLAIPTPSISFDGPSNISGVSPPDPNGEVGPNHYVVMTNLSFQIFSKTGTSLFGPAANNTLWAGFGGPCQVENSGDPVVLYDQLADRWLLSQFTSAGPNFYNCVALSQTSDPTGTYYRWAFTTGTNFPDYPKYGMGPSAYYISTREFQGVNGPFQGVGAYATNRAQMLAGNPNPQVISFLAPPSPAYTVGDGLLPADLDGTTLPPAGNPEYYAGTMDNNGPYGAPQDAITLWKFHVDFATPANSSFTLANTLPTAPFNSAFPCSPGARDCIPQPMTSQKVDVQSIRQRPLFRLAYRNMGTYESLVTNQSVDAGAGPGSDIAGVRWYELRSPNSSPVIYQQGTYAPGLTDGIHRWMGSIAMDHNGNIALGYSASSTTVFPSIRYTGRLAGDPLGQMPQGEASIMVGSGSQTGSARWGDYTDMTVDPVDDCTFWYVNQYLPTTSPVGWRTRIGAFKFPGCTLATPTPTVTGTPPTATATACAVSTTPVTAGFESGLGSFAAAVATCAPGGCGWTAVTTDKHTGAQSAFAPDRNGLSDQMLALSSGFAIPANATTAVLSFWHRVATENGFDGGVLEFSTNNGATWSATDPTFLTGGYNATISTSYQSPIGGRHAWSGTIGSTGNFVNVQVNLIGYAGQANLRFRFREANDTSVAATGWWVDDVSVTITAPCASTPTATATRTPTRTPVPPTRTPTATATPVNCPLPFTDVDQFNPFYQYIQCLYCRGIISGYADNTFRWSADVTRGQVSKIIANAAGLNGTVTTQTFTDVPPGSPFFVFIGRLVAQGAISGYNTAANCPSGVPCFRPELSVTRGQLAKIDANAAGYNETPGATPTFKDVPAANPFYVFIERLSLHGVINGYTCGGPGEPCPGLYFRPNANITRGQVSKVASQTFFPLNCAPGRAPVRQQ